VQRLCPDGFGKPDELPRDLRCEIESGDVPYLASCGLELEYHAHGIGCLRSLTATSETSRSVSPNCTSSVWTGESDQLGRSLQKIEAVRNVPAWDRLSIERRLPNIGRVGEVFGEEAGLAFVLGRVSLGPAVNGLAPGSPATSV
jgi:hypothetical protein